MHNLIQHIKHLLAATNQYGVHSPFVYNYLTKGLYSKQKYQGSKTEKIVLKSIGYFSMTQINIISEDLKIKAHLEKKFGFTSNENPPFDLIYFDQVTNDLAFTQKENLHNGSMVIINNIHENKSTTASWAELIQNKAITVSIDLFYCGVLFFRKEQIKEHFKIRI